MKKVSLLILFSILIIIFSLLFFRSKGSFSQADSGISAVMAPFGLIFNNSTQKVHDFFANFSNIGNLQRENSDLKTKINSLEADVARMKESDKENSSLRKELKFRDESGFQTIPAEITFFDPTNLRETVVINKGQKDGVTSGMVAMSEGFLIGRVSEVNSGTSKILLITDPLSSIPALLQSNGASGMVKGQVGAGLLIDQIPQESDLKKGDLAVTSGIGGDYPKGLIIGSLENITKKNNSIFQFSSIRPYANFKSLERVQLIR